MFSYLNKKKNYREIGREKWERDGTKQQKQILGISSGKSVMDVKCIYCQQLRILYKNGGKRENCLGFSFLFSLYFSCLYYIFLLSLPVITHVFLTVNIFFSDTIPQMIYDSDILLQFFI